MQNTQTLPLPDAEATADMARRLAALAAPGDTYLLEGPIGAGKSHFARAFIKHLMHLAGQPEEDIPSPTFTLVQTYEIGEGEVWHADLYRLTGPDDCWELGFDTAFGSAICLIEWPDRLGPDAPETALTLRFEPLENDAGRILHLSASAPLWNTRLQKITGQ
ncbi:tRNA (adenosine(37)-N6)-threonylcarbamoyltransferase complex ATPase subunit type 1 TsaE [Alphaproteobacteria bacterium KMM 3653]|uniref:tRNA threonylcarbamoyladenosine biosynthesis protein TsaE n=1 Tax=Harenicola maris TaxID=2841044 RepID=A0AAP2G7Y0_9RHOB|nr:tRNA (adenosine(37)-N6)-threonylcarbamoyltransferase complex ATPase subunit type 1 TsaE [Harenicola maris]